MSFRGSTREIYVVLFSLVNQTAEQIFGVVDDICCGVTKSSVGIVSKTQDPGTNNVQREVVSKPEGFAFRVRPSLDRITVESMDSNDTEPSQELTNADLQAFNTYSTVRASLFPNSAVGCRTNRTMLTIKKVFLFPSH